MCGRSVSKTGAAIERYFNVRPHQYTLFDRYNVAPGIDIPVIRLVDGERILRSMRWDLIPSWAKDTKIGYKMINARAETVATKPAFRAAYKARCCLVPASGFYEWKRDVEPKQPDYIHRQDEDPLVSRLMGDLARRGPDDRELHHHHDRSQRADGRATPPHAGDLGPAGLATPAMH